MCGEGKEIKNGSEDVIGYQIKGWNKRKRVGTRCGLKKNNTNVG